MATGRWDFFYRVENKQFDPDDIRDLSVDLPADLPLADALAAAHAAGLPKGSQRSGCFQAQNDLGIWDSHNGKRFDPAKATFRTWEELDTTAAMDPAGLGLTGTEGHGTGCCKVCGQAVEFCPGGHWYTAQGL